MIEIFGWTIFQMIMTIRNGAIYVLKIKSNLKQIFSKKNYFDAQNEFDLVYDSV